MKRYDYEFKCKTCGKLLWYCCGCEVQNVKEKLEKHLAKEYTTNSICCFKPNNQEYIKLIITQAKLGPPPDNVNWYDDSLNPKNCKHIDWDKFVSSLKKRPNYNQQMCQEFFPKFKEGMVAYWQPTWGYGTKYKVWITKVFVDKQLVDLSLQGAIYRGVPFEQIWRTND
jgi:hypothetical protein